MRPRGWDLRPWPNRFALFGFSPELSDLVTQTSDADLYDLGILMEGASIILKNNGVFYSQLLQEALAASIASRSANPFYLEIGAFHPEKYSNTASLRKFLRWDGLSVDPSLESLQSFKEYGLDKSFLNVGVGAESGFAYFVADGAFSQTTAFPSNQAVEIPIVGIRELIQKHPQVDYISLDIEGGELEIMKVFPWDICKPMLFTIEHNGITEVVDELHRIMSAEGYRVVLSSISNFESWFVRK